MKKQQTCCYNGRFYNVKVVGFSFWANILDLGVRNLYNVKRYINFPRRISLQTDFKQVNKKTANYTLVDLMWCSRWVYQFQDTNTLVNQKSKGVGGKIQNNNIR